MTPPDITLRDYFAAAVAPTITHAVLKTASDRIEERIANASYGIADALLKKRSAHESAGLAQEKTES